MHKTNLYSITVPPMIKSLKALSAILDKAVEYAETKATERHSTSFHMLALLNDRLIFDQFSLLRQIQIVTDNAKGAVHRLTGIEVPKFEDNHQSVEELKERIAKTIEILESVSPEQFEDKEEVRTILPYFPDKYMTGFDYVTGYLIPNFYFHFTTAYSILRKNGVNLGKADYIGSLSLKDL